MSQDQTAEFERLVQATLRVNSTEDLESMCRHILEGGRLVLRSEAASLLLIDETNATLKWFSALGEAGDVLENQDLSLDEGVAGWVARVGESVLIPDAAADPRFCDRIDALSGFVTRSLVCVPMVAQGRILGVLQFLNHPDGHPYTDDDVRKAQAFASLSAVALQNHHLIKLAEEVGNVREIGRFKNDMVTLMTEELRNPLTAIRGFSEVLVDDEADLAVLRGFASRIAGEVKRVERMIDGFVELARIETGQTPMREDDLALHDLFEATQARWSVRGEHRALRLVEPDEPAASVVADRERVAQILDHLLSNAMAASPQGGPVTVKAARRGATWRISVTDRGVGIAPENQVRLFHPFYRVPHPSHPQPPRAGLGLSLVRALAQRMGGQVGVDSDPERGTTFWFTLPASEAAKA